MRVFVGCLPIDPERWAKAFQAWSKCHEIFCGQCLPLPDEAKELTPIINAPNYEEESLITTGKFMRQPPRHQKRVL